MEKLSIKNLDKLENHLNRIRKDIRELNKEKTGNKRIDKRIKKLEKKLDIDWKGMPRQMEIDWKNMPKTEFPKIPKPPKVQKVLVNNFPDEIPNRVVIERKENDDIKNITEYYDDFILTMDISVDGKRTEVSINKK